LDIFEATKNAMFDPGTDGTLDANDMAMDKNLYHATIHQVTIVVKTYSGGW
jgi:hypothetical protein